MSSIEHKKVPDRRIIADMAERKFEDVQRDLDDTLWNLKGIEDSEFRVLLLRKMSHLLEEAHRILASPN